MSDKSFDNYIEQEAHKWRVWKLKQFCEFCEKDPIKAEGICMIVNEFIYGKRCRFCLDLIEAEQRFASVEFLVNKVGKINMGRVKCIKKN